RRSLPVSTPTKSTPAAVICCRSIPRLPPIYRKLGRQSAPSASSPIVLMIASAGLICPLLPPPVTRILIVRMAPFYHPQGLGVGGSSGYSVSPTPNSYLPSPVSAARGCYTPAVAARRSGD